MKANGENGGLNPLSNEKTVLLKDEAAVVETATSAVTKQEMPTFVFSSRNQEVIDALHAALSQYKEIVKDHASFVVKTHTSTWVNDASSRATVANLIDGVKAANCNSQIIMSNIQMHLQAIQVSKQALEDSQVITIPAIPVVDQAASVVDEVPEVVITPLFDIY